MLSTSHPRCGLDIVKVQLPCVTWSGTSSWLQNYSSRNVILLVCRNTLISTTSKEAGVLLYQLPYLAWCKQLMSAHSNLIDATLFSGLLASLFSSYLSAGLKFKTSWIITSKSFLFFPSTRYFCLPKYQGSHLTFTTHAQ